MTVRPLSEDPYLAYNFLVEIMGLVIGGFSEVSGLQAEVEVTDYREGGVNGYIHRLAGPTRYSANLILKHGLTDIEGLWNWHQEVIQGLIQRRNISVILLDTTGVEKRRWNFRQAYPVKWIGPDLRAGTSEVAVETVELVHHGLSKGKKP